MPLTQSATFIAFLLGAMPSPGGLRNGRLDFGPQGILRLVGVASMYPSSCNSESSFDGSRHQGGLPGGRVWRTRRKTQWTCSPSIPVLGLCRRAFLRRGQDLPGTVPALGPQKPQGPCLPSNFSFSSPGLTAEDGPSHHSRLLAMEPTRPAPLSRRAHPLGSASTSFLSSRRRTNSASCPSISAAQTVWLMRRAATAHLASAPAPAASALDAPQGPSTMRS